MTHRTRQNSQDHPEVDDEDSAGEAWLRDHDRNYRGARDREPRTVRYTEGLTAAAGAPAVPTVLRVTVSRWGELARILHALGHPDADYCAALARSRSTQEAARRVGRTPRAVRYGAKRVLEWVERHPLMVWGAYARLAPRGMRPPVVGRRPPAGRGGARVRWRGRPVQLELFVPLHLKKRQS